MSKTYAYIRVSTKDQNEDRQRLAMTEFGVPENHKVFGIAAIGYAAAETPVKEKKFPVTYVE